MTRRQHSNSQALTASFVDRLLEAVERSIAARTRVLTAEWLDAALATHRDAEQARLSAAQATTGAPRDPDRSGDQLTFDPAQEGSPGPSAVRRTTGRRRGARLKTPVAMTGAAPALPSPEQQRRDAEFARLRALLKPTAQDDASAAAEITPPPAVAMALPSDPLRLLEDEIRDQAHGLAQLPASACTARIAAWAGRVRSYEETTGNRVAAQLMLDKLRALARAMDAGRIEALNASWRTRDWPFYVRTNEALAEASAAAKHPSSDSPPEQTGEPDYRDVWSQPS